MGRLRNGKNEDLEIEYGISWGVWTYATKKGYLGVIEHIGYKHPIHGTN